jgi:hypothetical protein
MKQPALSRSAFFILRFLLALVLCFIGFVLAFAASTVSSPSEDQNPHTNAPVIGYLAGATIYPRDWQKMQEPFPLQQRPMRLELEPPADTKQLLDQSRFAHGPDINVVLGTMPTPIQTFGGLSYTDTCVGGQCGGAIPPDANGDVGRNHYVQAVNDGFAVYSKGGQLLASWTEYLIWRNTACTYPYGDAVVLYDPTADRWILTNLGAGALDANGHPASPFYQCIAVSITSDPTQGLQPYVFQIDTGGTNKPPANTLNDYPRFGIWTDCLYYSANGFDASTRSYTGGIWGTFPIADMYAGRSTVTMGLGYLAGTTDYYTMVPSNISGPAGALPPAGRRNYYVQQSQTTPYNFKVRAVTPGTNCGGFGTISGPTLVGETNYTVPAGNIVPQPAPATSSNNLDSLGDRIMQKVQYRKVGSTESLWLTHTFRSSSVGPTGSQWAQINVTGGTIATTPVQQQLYDPGDGTYRWNSSLAADKDGNVALGYSASGTSNFPSIAYSGRLVGDTPNMLPQSETILAAGNGSQVNSCRDSSNNLVPCQRWGDYSSMSVDPDGCTFWYTNQYYVNQTNGNNGTWNTRIASFKFPSCGSAVRSDFNHDGVCDIPWQDNNSIGRTIWLMTPSGWQQMEQGLTISDPAWEIATTGDFDRDGNVDIIWHNRNSGQYVFWLMDGARFKSDKGFALTPRSEWKLVGAADFDGDGNTDLLWEDQNTEDLTIWIMNGTNYVRDDPPQIKPNAPGWHVVGTGDFNGDGKVDILWENTGTGAHTVWLMNGTKYVQDAGLSLNPGSLAWHVGGTGDFDGDSKVDIIWQNTNTGQRTIWLMNRTNYVRDLGLPNKPTNWEIRNH